MAQIKKIDWPENIEERLMSVWRDFRTVSLAGMSDDGFLTKEHIERLTQDLQEIIWRQRKLASDFESIHRLNTQFENAVKDNAVKDTDDTW